jgi:hypothetical protein
MKADPSLVSIYLEEQAKIFKVRKHLREKLSKAELEEKKYKEYKQILIPHVVDILDRSINDLEEIARDISDKFKILNTYRTSLHNEGKILIEKYEGSGLNGIMKNIIEMIDIPMDEVLEYLSDTFNRQHFTTFRSKISEKDRIIELYKKEIEERDERYLSLSNDYKNEVNQKDRIIEDYKKQNLELEAQIEELKSIISLEDTRINDSRNKLDEAQKTIENQAYSLVSIIDFPEALYIPLNEKLKLRYAID